ncbi:MAG: hypothetical protein WHV26_05645 [Spirochaetota bacterium]
MYTILYKRKSCKEEIYYKNPLDLFIVPVRAIVIIRYTGECFL